MRVWETTETSTLPKFVHVPSGHLMREKGNTAVSGTWRGELTPPPHTVSSLEAATLSLSPVSHSERQVSRVVDLDCVILAKRGLLAPECHSLHRSRSAWAMGHFAWHKAEINQQLYSFYIEG